MAAVCVISGLCLAVIIAWCVARRRNGWHQKEAGIFWEPPVRCVLCQRPVDDGKFVCRECEIKEGLYRGKR